MWCGHRCSSDPALLWLWCRPAAIPLIGPLAWEPPYAAGTTLKTNKKVKCVLNRGRKRESRRRGERGNLGDEMKTECVGLGDHHGPWILIWTRKPLTRCLSFVFIYLFIFCKLSWYIMTLWFSVLSLLRWFEGFFVCNVLPFLFLFANLFFFNSTAVLRNNSHTTQFTCLKCTIQWGLVYS